MSVSQATFQAQAAAFLAAATAYNVLAQNAGGPATDFTVAAGNLATVSADLGLALFLPAPVYEPSTITGCVDWNGRETTSVYFNPYFDMTSMVLTFSDSNPAAGNWSVSTPVSPLLGAQFSGPSLSVWYNGPSGYTETLQINDGTAGGPFFLDIVVY